MKNNVLIVVAHPDDETLGCGGTIVNHILKGDNVKVLSLSTGRGQPDFKEACGILGVNTVDSLLFPDNQFDTVTFLRIVKELELYTHDTDIIYTHFGHDLNIDHELTYRAVITACRPPCVREIYSFEVLSSTEWSFGNPFQPNVFENITNTLYFKIKAMEAYKNEIRSYPHPRSSEAILANAMKLGSVAGVEFAEAFQLVRSLR